VLHSVALLLSTLIIDPSVNKSVPFLTSVYYSLLHSGVDTDASGNIVVSSSPSWCDRVHPHSIYGIDLDVDLTLMTPHVNSFPFQFRVELAAYQLVDGFIKLKHLKKKTEKIKKETDKRNKETEKINKNTEKMNHETEKMNKNTEKMENDQRNRGEGETLEKQLEAKKQAEVQQQR